MPRYLFRRRILHRLILATVDEHPENIFDGATAAKAVARCLLAWASSSGVASRCRMSRNIDCVELVVGLHEVLEALEHFAMTRSDRVECRSLSTTLGERPSAGSRFGSL